jgi:TatD DNase family protein
MIDTHSHIHGREFIEDFPEMLKRAQDAGVERVALVGVHMEDTDRALAVANSNPNCYVVAGVHPHEAKLWDQAACEVLKGQITANRNRVVAVGEMGLDYHYDFAPKDAQRKAFLGQLNLARELDLPIVIHCREAYDDCLEILKDFYGSEPADSSRPRGVLHCWFGTIDQAKESVALGFLLGIGGACTFKKADELHRVVSEIPLEYLVLETDAPFMAPVPYRGKRNEPAFLTHVIARIAELKGITAEEVDKTTTANAKRLYRWAD